MFSTVFYFLIKPSFIVVCVHIHVQAHMHREAGEQILFFHLYLGSVA